MGILELLKTTLLMEVVNNNERSYLYCAILPILEKMACYKCCKKDIHVSAVLVLNGATSVGTTFLGVYALM